MSSFARPVARRFLVSYLRDHVLTTYLADSAKARCLRADGTYELVKPDPGAESLDSQQWFIEHRHAVMPEPA
jgi:hypothetical protein